MQSLECDFDDPDQWEYKGEGNASLVIASKKTHKVLKLCKCFLDPNIRQTSDTSYSDDYTEQQVKFVADILKPLLASYICLPEIIPVSTKFLQSINNKVKDSRPSSRVHKIVDIQSKFALCLPDLSFLHPHHDEIDTPVYCVEIKPKIGFLSISPWIPAEEEVKKEVCYYCRLQHLKVEEGTWSERSKYCPIDLFSGNPIRMKYALNQLLENPQNNLRMFKNGELLYGTKCKNKPSLDDQDNLHKNLDPFFGVSVEEAKGDDINPLKRPAIQSFLDVVVKTLLHSKEEKSLLHGKSCLPNQTCKASHFDETQLSEQKSAGNQKACKLPDGSILNVISQVQQLDDIDIEGVYAMYEKYHKVKSCTADGDCEAGKPLDWPYDARQFLQRIISPSSSSPPMITQDVEQVSMNDAVHKIRSFMLAGTAKDCSVLLSIQPVGNAHRWTHPYSCHHGDKTYLFSSHIIDLDSKPSSRIPKYYKQDKKLVKLYQSL